MVPRPIFLCSPKLKPILVYFIFINCSLCFKRVMCTFYNTFQNVGEKEQKQLRFLECLSHLFLQILSVMPLSTHFAGAFAPHHASRPPPAESQWRKHLILVKGQLSYISNPRNRYFLSKSKHNFSLQTSCSTCEHVCINVSCAPCIEIFLWALNTLSFQQLDPSMIRSH